jgi:UDP-glucose 4-epimerase
VTADLTGRAHAALESIRDGASTQYNLGNGRPTSVRTAIDSVDWTPRFENSDLVVEAGGRRRDAHPHGCRRAKP